MQYIQRTEGRLCSIIEQYEERKREEKTNADRREEM